MDPNNPIVKLCAQGMEAEMKGSHDEARLLFVQAWDQSTDDYEASIAAHYLARHQPPEDTLRWNQESLDRANSINDERVQDFFPSLYLNMGKAHEDLGDRQQARTFYELASARMNSLPDDRYGDMVRDGIERGLLRVSD
jgi:predicted negative regulator of RcsB-dependent stress response